MPASPSPYRLYSVLRRILRQCLGSVGKQAVCGEWTGDPGTAYVPLMTWRGLPALAVLVSGMTKRGNQMMSEVRYGVGAVLAGRREVPCMLMAAWPCFLQPADYHACVCPCAATQTARGQRCSVESCEQAKRHGLRVVWKVAGEAGWVGLGECSWGFSARRKVFRKKIRVRAGAWLLHKRAFSLFLPCRAGRLKRGKPRL